MRLPRQFCNDGGCRIAYAVQGRGPVVLLLHGLGGTADFWQPVIAALATRYTLIAPDLLGFGYSDKPDNVRYTPMRHAQAVDAVLRAQEVRNVAAVVGHSCGGVVAAQLIAAGHIHPERLVFAAVPYPSPRFPVRRELLGSPLDRLMLAWRPLAHLVHTTLALCWPLLHRLAVPPQLQGARAGYLEHTIPSYVGTAEECLFRADLDPIIPLLPTIPTLLIYIRQCAICYTDFWEAYQGILPCKRHRPVGKDSGQTNHIERFNNTLRQRCSRLVRKTLSFSKKLANHIGALWYFIHDYNACIRAKLLATTYA